MTGILAAAVVLVVPGAAWLVWLGRSHTDFLDWLAEACALSVSLSALVALGAFLLRASFRTEAVIAWYAAAGLILLAGLFIRRRKPSWRELLWAAAGLLALAGLILWRLYQARSLALPAWVDSAHHVFIVQKILENGGIPASLAPELPGRFSYHYAFHLITAVWSNITGLAPERAVLVFGQVINALVALAVYRLANAFWEDRRAAGLAGLLVGFGFHMPAYYVTWGRYTLLTGLIVLPVAIAAVASLRSEFNANPKRFSRWAAALTFALLTAGVALAHYTTLLLFAFFLFIWGIGQLAADLLHKNGRGSLVWPAAAAVLLGLALAAPWLYRMLADLSHLAGVNVVSPLTDPQESYSRYLLYLLGPRRNFILLGIAGAGLIVGLARAQTRALATWGLLLALLTLPWGLRLPPFRPDHFAILLFVPAAPLAGGWVVWLGEQVGRLVNALLRQRSKLWLPYAAGFVLAAAAAIGLSVWGARQTANIINPVTILATEADVRALEWVESHTPPDAKFFVNTTGWIGDNLRGVDGGYWLMTLTRRQSTVMFAIANTGDSEYYRMGSEFAHRASAVNACDDNFRSLAADAGLTHIYIKDGVGQLQPGALTRCEGVTLLYGRDSVFIYEILPLE